MKAQNYKEVNPAWFSSESWPVDYQTRPSQIQFIDRLAMEKIRAELTYGDHGKLQCSQGELIGCSLIFDLQKNLTEDDRIIVVPQSPCEVRSLHYKMQEDYSEIAYLSLIWSAPSSETKRFVLRHEEDDESGFFFVDKNLMIIASKSELQKKMAALGSFDQLDEELFIHSQGINKDEIKRIGFADGFILQAPKGVCALIIEKTNNEISALHFDFGQFHSFGEDGEYDTDWEYLEEYKKLLSE